MDNLVSINHTKPNLLEFDLSIEGIKPEDISAKFVIKANGMDVAFEAVNIGKNKWEINLPELPILERTAYPFSINVDADGYHFEPLKGTVNVVGSNDVYVTTPKNPKISAPKSALSEATKPIKEEVVVPPPPKTKPGEKGIAQIAEELVAANNKKAKPTPKVKPKVEPKVEPVKEATVYTPPASLLPKIEVEPRKPTKGEKDDAVLSILEEAGLRPKGKPVQKSRFSLKD